MRRAAIVLLVLTATPALASSPSAWSAERRAAVKACIAAADLAQPSTSVPLGFSDTYAVDAVLVTGRWKPAHMKRAKATMLCLYDRRARKAEAGEALGWSAPAEKPN